MQRPCGVMMGLTENIQACLRIFRRAQHLWLVRDILHQPQGVYYVFVLRPPQEYSNEEPVLRRTALQAAFVVCYLYRGRCPRLLMVVPSRHRSACGENPLTESKTKTKLNPLVRMEDVALAVMLPLWSYKSELLTPKPEAYHHLPYRRSPSSPRR